MSKSRVNFVKFKGIIACCTANEYATPLATYENVTILVAPCARARDEVSKSLHG